MASELARATDELTGLLTLAEKYFVDLKLGVPASVVLEEDVVLEFTKREAVWILEVRGPRDGGRRLTGASRRIRVLAAAALPALRSALFDARDAQLKDVEAACALVATFLAEVEADDGV